MIDIITQYILEKSNLDKHINMKSLLKDKKYEVLNHITFKENIDNIKRKGLIPRKKYSKYGNIPKLKATYLFHANNKSVIKDFKKTFKNRYVVVISIKTNRLFPDLFYADEDYYRYPYKRKLPDESGMKRDAAACLIDRGVVAYKGIISSKYIVDIKDLK